MREFGLNIKTDTGGKRVELECEHQNGLLYVVPAESSWVCSEELMHAHAMAGFFRQLMELEDERVEELMQRWGLVLPPEAAGGVGHGMKKSRRVVTPALVSAYSVNLPAV